MNTLRALLKAQHPELSEALERSWKIALEQWLPAISPSSSSFNSYPHLRNVEACLDGIVNAFTPHSADASACFLNPLEIYVLLASILFHDIGRVGEEAAIKSKSPLKHAVFSRQTIVSSFAQLGTNWQASSVTLRCNMILPMASPLTCPKQPSAPTGDYAVNH